MEEEEEAMRRLQSAATGSASGVRACACVCMCVYVSVCARARVRVSVPERNKTACRPYVAKETYPRSKRDLT